MTARHLFGVLTLALASWLPSLALSADPAAPDQTEQPNLPLVTQATAETTMIEARVPISGSLVARQSVQVHANVSGYEIKTVKVEAGDQVKAGQVLAQLSDDALQAQTAQAQAELDRSTAAISQAESQITSAQASLTEAVAALDRTRSLRRSGNASQVVLDQAIAAEASAQAAASSASDGLGVARAAQAQAQAALRLAQLNLGYATITAPVDGVVTARNAELGAISGAGGEPLFTIVANGEIELAADVIETALGALKPGDPALIRIAGLGQIGGTLRLAPAAVDPATRLGLARITLDADARLRTGLFASGWIITDKRQALTVPTTAILDDDQGEQVQVIQDGTIETRRVRAGLIWDGRREVTEGLAAGEHVVARAGAFFSTGDKVRVAP